MYQIHRKLAKPFNGFSDKLLKRFRDYLVSPVSTLLKQGANETFEEIEGTSTIDFFESFVIMVY